MPDERGDEIAGLLPRHSHPVAEFGDLIFGGRIERGVIEGPQELH